ncbi:MAG: beta-lactamase family protein [Acidimicrobiales bacterium]|nr:beta-lactamase family protein [Acidimicrobiales bacterium]
MRPTPALVTALALSLAACSGGGGTSERSAPTTTTTAPPAEARPVSRAELAAFADDLVADTGAEGGIVAWRVGDGEPVVVTAGVADARTGQPLRPDDPFHVASVTKSYVAAALLSLEADGLVDLDAPIDEYVDWPGGEGITTRQLLDQTSGVAGFPNGDEDTTAYSELLQRDPPLTLDQTLAAARDLPPRGEPGEATSYGNLAYVLAGAVIEAATGEDVGTVLEERVFGPSDLQDTWYPPRGPGDAPPLPGVYEAEPGAPLLPTTAFDMETWRTVTAPASGAVSTVDDLLAWVDAALREQEVGGTDVSAMTAIGPGGYGLGVAGVSDEAGTCVFTGCPPGTEFRRWALNGDIPGASTRVFHDPATDATLVVVLNRNALELDRPMLAFLDA